MGARLTKQAFLSTFTLLVGLGVVWGENLPVTIKVDKVCGVDTYHAPNTIQLCAAQDAENMVFDKGVAAQAREGFVTYLTLGTSEPVRGLWPYRAEDGTDWVLALSSSTLFGYNGTATSALISGLNPTARMDCASCLGDTYCTDRSTDVFSFNGSSITYDAGAPKASLVECWRNRVILGDVSGEQSTFYMSGELNGTDWTTGTKSTSPVTWRVGGVNDAGNRIKCMRAGFGDFLFLGTPGNTWGFFGNDQRDFQLSQLFSDVGCLDDGTVQEHMGELTWVSNKGVERYDRNVLAYPRVSEPIRNITDGLVSSSASEFSWVQTSKTDFDLGTHSRTSADVQLGSVVLSTYGATDTANADFVSGTPSNTTVIGDRVYLSTNNTNVENYSFESGTDNWDDVGDVGSNNVVCTPYVGSYKAVLGASGVAVLYGQVLDSAGNVLATQNLGGWGELSACSWTAKTIPTAAYVGRYIKIRFVSLSNSLTSDGFIGSGSNTSVMVSKFGAGTSIYMFLVDAVTGGRSTVSSGVFTSRTFNTGLSSATFSSDSAVTFTLNGGGATFSTQESVNGTAWGDAVAWSTATAPVTVSYAPYKRYIFNLTIGTSGAIGLPYVDAVTVSAREKTGTFISQPKDVTGATLWGNFETNQTTNGGTITYYTRSSGSESGLSTSTWFAQNSFAAVAAPLDNWVQYRTDFAISSGTQDPIHNDATIFWRTGAASPALASAVYEDRYHLFYTTNTTTDAYNNLAVPLDRNGAWTLFSGINAASTAQYRNMLLFGSATGTGKVYRMYSGYSDDGAAIPIRLNLKDFDGGDSDALKIFHKLYLTAGHEASAEQDVDINVSYTVDGDETVFSLGTVSMAENVGRINAKIPFPKDQGIPLRGRWLSPRISGSILDAPFSLYGLNIYGVSEGVR